MKKITIVWTIVLVIVVAGLTCIGLKVKEDNKSNIMEESLEKQAQKYFGLYPSLFPVRGEEKRMSADELKTKGYDAKLDEGCTGYVRVTNENSGYKYYGYIKCSDYTTKGYEEE